MKVKFKRQFFGPNGYRYRKDVVHGLPDSWAKLLPRGATVIEEAPASVVAEVEKTGDDETKEILAALGGEKEKAK